MIVTAPGLGMRLKVVGGFYGLSVMAGSVVALSSVRMDDRSMVFSFIFRSEINNDNQTFFFWSVGSGGLAGLVDVIGGWNSGMAVEWTRGPCLAGLFCRVTLFALAANNALHRTCTCMYLIT